MRAMELEAKVSAAVERIRSGQQAEHDFIECKRDWPQENKARQLAGSLNRAGGDPVIYVIGIDEKTGDIHDPSGTDVLTWWDQIKTRFDQTPPEMVRHMDVAVGGGGGHVVAVAFASDRAPYVVKTGSANPSLEVPMREGTGTRSARRDELLRILVPAARVPRAVVLEAEIQAEHHTPTPARDDGRGPRPGFIHLSGDLKLFFEHLGSEMTTIPAYGIRASLVIGDHQYCVEAKPSIYGQEGTPAARLGVVAAIEQLSITGPGAVRLRLRSKPNPDLRDRGAFEQADSVTLRLELDVLDAVAPMKLDVQLRRVPPEISYQNAQRSFLGTWSDRHPGWHQ